MRNFCILSFCRSLQQDGYQLCCFIIPDPQFKLILYKQWAVNGLQKESETSDDGRISFTRVVPKIIRISYQQNAQLRHHK